MLTFFHSQIHPILKRRMLFVVFCFNFFFCNPQKHERLAGTAGLLSPFLNVIGPTIVIRNKKQMNIMLVVGTIFHLSSTQS